MEYGVIHDFIMALKCLSIDANIDPAYNMWVDHQLLAFAMAVTSTKKRAKSLSTLAAYI